MNPAVRTVSETDAVHVIEGLAYPFRGRDTYGTFFSTRCNFHWDLYPDVTPASVRAADEAKFIRPLTFHHGFDPEIGLTRIGGWSPVRMDADGVWVQAQIDKRNAYYATRIKPLLDAGALGLSGGSAEHSVRIDQRSGEVLDWPAYETAITPVESNPLAVIAARSGEITSTLRIVAAARGWLPAGTTQGDLDDGDFAWLATDKSLPDSDRRKLPYKIHGTVNEAGWKAAWSRANQTGTDFAGGPDAAAVKKKLLADKPADVEVSEAAKSGVRAWSEAASDAAMGAGALGTLLYLLGPEADEPDQVDMIQRAIDALTEWITAERAEVGTPDDMADSNGYLSGIRAGKRNAASDQTRIDAIHDHTVALGATAHTDTPADDDSDDAARAGERLPTIRVVERPDPAAVRAELMAAARKAGEDAARRLTG